MRFSTKAVVALILYLSAGVLSAPVPSSYGMQELVARADGKDAITKGLNKAITAAHTHNDLHSENIMPSGKLETVTIDYGNQNKSGGGGSSGNQNGGSSGTKGR